MSKEQSRLDDVVKTGRETLCGRYLRNFWQPIYRSQDLKRGRAVPVEILSEKFTLYRGESGSPHIVAFKCAHRGTQLSTGWVEGEDIRCRYHGWKYDACGQCVEQPSESISFASKVRIRSWPAQDYLGLIWGYFGEKETPSFRRFADLEGEGLLIANPPEMWPCNYFNRLENDSAHPPFTHRESLRRVGRQLKPGGSITAEEMEYGVRFTRAGRQTYTYFFMPNLVELGREPGTIETRVPGAGKTTAYPNVRLLIYVPINDGRCVTFPIDYLEIDGSEATAYREQCNDFMAKVDTARLNKLAESVLAGETSIEDLDANLSTFDLFWIEDYVTAVGQGAFADRNQERLGQSDKGVILIRKLFDRELSALAKGAQLTPWCDPPKGLTDEKAPLREVHKQASPDYIPGGIS
ncbi:MAG TPA: Rieske 2Fe-2S domain-containing protein [Candidatus Binatia bacterium]|jgi:5,5'-dehydrodivanillate O-demethylase|nr:Rieske 2Fe-2S domain-containing protein [Candidatus Binatia bacterium]